MKSNKSILTTLTFLACFTLSIPQNLYLISKQQEQKIQKDYENRLINYDSLNKNGWELYSNNEKDKRISNFKTFVKEGYRPVFKSSKDYPKEGMIPNEEMAIKLAVIYWSYIHKEEYLSIQKPFVAVLDKNKIWRVSGVLPPNFTGESSRCFIRKLDGKVIFID